MTIKFQIWRWWWSCSSDHFYESQVSSVSVKRRILLVKFCVLYLHIVDLLITVVHAFPQWQKISYNCSTFEKKMFKRIWGNLGNIRRRHKSDVESFLTSLLNGEEEDNVGKVLVPNIRVSYFSFKVYVQQHLHDILFSRFYFSRQYTII